MASRLLAAGLAFTLAGCSLATRAGVALLYRKADLPAARIVRDVCYSALPCTTPDHMLDLYLPALKDWPVIVFVHGGNWDSGRKDLRAGGADIYANIGRFYASRGIGVAVINYRLQPHARWTDQVDDVRLAVTWVGANVGARGGRSDRLFLMGHSAGAHLAALVALTPDPGARQGLQGVIAVSGAALDLADERTYRLGADRLYYEERFRNGDATDGWKQRASPVRFADRKAPPFVILYATGETPALQRQSHLLHEALTASGAQSRLVPVRGESHTRIVLALSHPDKSPAQVISQFVRGD